MRLVVDIDGTICSQEKDYSNAVPFMNIIEGFNKLFDEGNEIIYHTARGTMTGIDWRSITEHQFNNWGVHYTDLVFGKPYGDIYIDDKAINIKDYK